MQRFKDLCSQDSFAIKHLHPVRCLVGSFISSLSHKQLGRSSVIWDGRKDVGMGTSGSGPGPRRVVVGRSLHLCRCRVAEIGTVSPRRRDIPFA